MKFGMTQIHRYSERKEIVMVKYERHTKEEKRSMAILGLLSYFHSPMTSLGQKLI